MYKVMIKQIIENEEMGRSLLVSNFDTLKDAEEAAKYYSRIYDYEAYQIREYDDKHSNIISFDESSDTGLVVREKEIFDYTEKRGDLFTVSKDYLLVHCISSDFVLGAGIAKSFRDKYKVKYELMKTGMKDTWKGQGYCVITDSFENGTPAWKVANLITKKRANGKPTYQTLNQALIDLRRQCVELDIKKLAVPYIGCGLDGLSWNVVSARIRSTFKDLPIEIIIYRFE